MELSGEWIMENPQQLHDQRVRVVAGWEAGVAAG